MSGAEAIILVGGFGTRLRPLVSDVPKPLAPIRGRPFLAWLLDRVAREGVARTVLATGYLSSLIEDAIGRDWQGMRIDYSVESEPLGTGGAIRLAASRLERGAAHVLNGDTYLEYAMSDFASAVEASGCAMGIALAQVDNVCRYGAVATRGDRVAAFREKGPHGPGLINAGSYYLTARAFAELPDEAAFSFETRVLSRSVEREGVHAFTATSSFIDIGVPEDYLRADDVIPGRVDA